MRLNNFKRARECYICACERVNSLAVRCWWSCNTTGWGNVVKRIVLVAVTGWKEAQRTGQWGYRCSSVVPIVPRWKWLIQNRLQGINWNLTPYVHNYIIHIKYNTLLRALHPMSHKSMQETRSSTDLDFFSCVMWPLRNLPYVSCHAI